MALVDLGRSNEVDAILSAASADDRAEITKTLEPAYEVAMKDPAPEKALAYRDALYLVAPGGGCPRTRSGSTPRSCRCSRRSWRRARSGRGSTRSRRC